MTRKKMNKTRPVVIIPTFNNERTIANVISDVKKYITDIIVVNDGSTDGTSGILRVTSSIELIEFGVNKGKGAALQAAFSCAHNNGFTHVITFDADGQHLAIDLPVLLEKIDEEPQVLWIGDRVLAVQDGVAQPPRSRFGRQFGAFWYKFYTGVYIRDTQCGLRVYPLNEILTLECNSPRYEYEIEIMISASWNDIKVKSVPVHLLYHTVEERVSHFRPVRDFLRISQVNSRAALARIFLPANVRKVKGVQLRAKVKTFIINELKANTSPKYAAASLALGVFMAITPFHGAQVLLILAISFFLKLNRPLAILGVSISSAPLLPFWIAAGLGTGKMCIPDRWAKPMELIVNNVIPSGLLSRLHLTAEGFATGFVQFFFGSLILAFVCGSVTFLVALPVCRKLIRPTGSDRGSVELR